MAQTKAKKRRSFDPNALNTEGMVLWFDDLGSGNPEYRFLSNFYAGEPITLPGLVWGYAYGDISEADVARTATANPQAAGLTENNIGKPVEFATGEHAFQALKALDPIEFRNIALAPMNPDANECKHRGRTCNLRPDWEGVKMDVMAAVVRAKYTLSREEGQWLLDTGDKLLVEGTFWADKVWGVDFTDGMLGRNWLGTLLMARRAELRAQSLFGKVGTADASETTQKFVEFFVDNTALSNMTVGGI